MVREKENETSRETEIKKNRRRGVTNKICRRDLIFCACYPRTDTEDG